MASKSTNFSRFKIFLRSGDAPKIFVAGIKNKWNWSLLSQKDRNDNFLSNYCVKIYKSGYTWCTWCNKQIVYDSGGKKDLITSNQKEIFRASE